MNTQPMKTLSLKLKVPTATKKEQYFLIENIEGLIFRTPHSKNQE